MQQQEHEQQQQQHGTTAGAAATAVEAGCKAADAARHIAAWMARADSAVVLPQQGAGRASTQRIAGGLALGLLGTGDGAERPETLGGVGEQHVVALLTPSRIIAYSVEWAAAATTAIVVQPPLSTAPSTAYSW